MSPIGGSSSSSTVDTLPSAETIESSSPSQFAQPEETLFFLDWDDTLFPTTELIERWGLPSQVKMWDDMVLSEAQREAMERWDGVLFEYLATASAVSDQCCIVTNASVGWVEACVARWAPRVSSFFAGPYRPQVINARELLLAHQRSSRPVLRGDEDATQVEIDEKLTKGKRLAMRQAAVDFHNQHPNQTLKNIISIGDSHYEWHAVQDLAFWHDGPAEERFRIKAVITPPMPSLDELTFRMQLATVVLPAFASFDGDLDIAIHSNSSFLQAVAAALDLPELERVRLPTCFDKGEASAIDKVLDDVEAIIQQSMHE